jgi:N-acetylglutamate synthase-like GNAT family acetyltransferase
MLTEIVIRLATRHEQEALKNLQRRASLMWEEDREALLAHPDVIEVPLEQIEAGRTFVAERHGEIVGFGVVLPRSEGDADLDGLFVEPTVWKQGIGGLLVREAERLAVSEGAKSLYVISNPRTQGFYAACAFELIGEESTPFGIGLTMRKRLHGGT